MNNATVRKRSPEELAALSYSAWLDSEEWAAIKDDVFKRDGYRCMVCNYPEDLVVHHRHYPKKRGSEQLSDLTTLCSVCNQLFHSRVKLWEKHRTDV